MKLLKIARENIWDCNPPIDGHLHHIFRRYRAHLCSEVLLSFLDMILTALSHQSAGAVC